MGLLFGCLDMSLSQEDGGRWEGIVTMALQDRPPSNRQDAAGQKKVRV